VPPLTISSKQQTLIIVTMVQLVNYMMVKLLVWLITMVWLVDCMQAGRDLLLRRKHSESLDMGILKTAWRT